MRNLRTSHKRTPLRVRLVWLLLFWLIEYHVNDVVNTRYLTGIIQFAIDEGRRVLLITIKFDVAVLVTATLAAVMVLVRLVWRLILLRHRGRLPYIRTRHCEHQSIIRVVRRRAVHSFVCIGMEKVIRCTINIA